MPPGFDEAMTDARGSAGYVVLVGWWSPKMQQPIRLWRHSQYYPANELGGLADLIRRDFDTMRPAAGPMRVLDRNAGQG